MGKSDKEMVGNIAINDSLLLESFIFKIIKRHFGSEPYYAELLNLFHEVSKNLILISNFLWENF